MSLATSEEPEDLALSESVQAMLQTDCDQRGTVASVAQEIDVLSRDGASCSYIKCIIAKADSYCSMPSLVAIRYSLGSAVVKDVSHDLQAELVRFYAVTYPDAEVRSRSNTSILESPNYVVKRARSHKHVVLDGRRSTLR